MKKLRSHHFYDQPWFWDALIIVLIGFSLWSSFWFWDALKLDHNAGVSTLLWILFAVMAVGCALTIYGSFIEPLLLIIHRKKIQIQNAPALRIAIASDFHVGAYNGKEFIERIAKRINSLKPDMIFLLGDFIESEESSIEELAPLKMLTAPHGVFAITGNHDAGHYMTWDRIPYTTIDRTEDIRALLTSMKITFLRNKHVILKIGKQEIAIAGTDDSFMESCDLDATLKNIPESTPIILLSHNPDIINDPHHERCDLIVSGHTHGGQLRLPFIGALGPIPTRIARKFDQGLFQLTEKTKLFITHGLGETWARARLFCPPEIVLLDIENKS